MAERGSKPAPANGAHVFEVRVYFEDTDAGGVVYYANYLKFAERARTEMLRGLGLENSALMDSQGIVFAVHHCAADFLKPARLDDLLEVHSRLVKVGGASLRFEQRIERDGEDVVRLDLSLACMTPSGRPARLPREVRDSFIKAKCCNWNERD